MLWKAEPLHSHGNSSRYGEHLVLDGTLERMAVTFFGSKERYSLRKWKISASAHLEVTFRVDVIVEFD